MFKLNRLFQFLTFGLFGFIFFHLAKNMLQVKPEGWYVGHINLYGDLVFHLSLVNKFLSSNSILIDNPIFALDKINYPPLVDFFTALISKLTGITFALFITTFLGGILTIYVSRLFINSFIKNEKIVFLVLLLFLFGGGFGFYYFFQDYFISQKSIFNFLFSMPGQYTDIKEKGYWFINPLLAYFIPQRGFLFAFPITLTILLVLYKGITKNKRFNFLIAGLLAGTLPLVQVHSLFLVFLLSLFYAPASLVFAKDKKKTLVNWFLFATLTIFLTLPITGTISSTQNPLEFIKFAPGWTSKENIIWFWFKNLGLFIPTLLVSLFWLYKKSRHFFNLYIPFLFIFIICNLFIFQPWDFDNSKLLVYWFFVSCIVVGYFLYDQFFQEGLFRKFTGFIIVSILILSSALDIFRTFTPVTSYQIFSTLDLQVAEEVKNLTPQNAVFATASTHNHPIPSLAGRSTLVGFNGWLWSHGIDYQKRTNDLVKIFKGTPEADNLISQYRISYVTIGPLEKQNFVVNETYFQKFEKINLGNKWSIYNVSNLWSDSNR